MTIVTSWVSRFRRPAVEAEAVSTFPKFTRQEPSDQNALDIFRGRWACDLSGLVPGTRAGGTNLFEDPRISEHLLRRFAGPAGDLAGQRVLEIGPLEGAHTYQLERLGATVTAVEANTEAYLKCLIVKEILQLSQARFLYGDAVEYLRREDIGRFDLIVCCGVLYHLADPAELISLLAAKTDRVYLWTHYEMNAGNAHQRGTTIVRKGESYTYHERDNSDRKLSNYWGGNRAVSVRMTRSDIFRCFRAEGLTEVEVHEDNEHHPGGPALGVSIWRTLANC